MRRILLTLALTLLIDAHACQWLTAHHPSDDVEYKPGVSADGRAVAPADLDGSRSSLSGRALTEHVALPVTRELANKMGIAGQFFKAEANIGLIEVNEDGKLLFNGEPLQNGSEAELAALCRNAAASR